MTQNNKLELAGGATAAAADRVVFVYTTFPTLEAAEQIGGGLVDAGLAACINILPGMVSIYRWQGARHRDSEVVGIVKTRSRLVAAVVAAIRARHGYENPAIAVIPVDGGSEPFLAWIAAQTSGGGDGGG